MTGKRPVTWDTESELSLQKISHSDPESGYYAKGEWEKQFIYSAHTSCEDNGFDEIPTGGEMYNGKESVVPYEIAEMETGKNLSLLLTYDL